MNIDWKALFLSPAGRIKRQTYWIGWACQIVAALVIGIVVSPISIYAGTIVGLILLYPMYCIYAKRLQDLGKPGTLAAIPVGLAVVSQALSLYMLVTLGLKTGFAGMGGANQEVMMSHMGTVMTISGVSALIGLVSLVFWLVLGIATGQEGPNAYGPEPGSEDETTFG